MDVEHAYIYCLKRQGQTSTMRCNCDCGSSFRNWILMHPKCFGVDAFKGLTVPHPCPFTFVQDTDLIALDFKAANSRLIKSYKRYDGCKRYRMNKVLSKCKRIDMDIGAARRLEYQAMFSPWDVMPGSLTLHVCEAWPMMWHDMLVVCFAGWRFCTFLL